MTESDRYLLISDPRDYLPVLEGHHAHPFAMAAKAYWHMLRDEEQQVVTVRYLCARKFYLQFSSCNDARTHS